MCAHLVSNELLVDATDEDVHGVVDHKLSRDVLDLLGPRGREEERLALRRQRAHDLLNLGFEPHIEHSVSFIEHKVRHLAEANLIGLHKVVEAAWGRDDDFHAAVDRSNLRPLGSAAVHAPDAMAITVSNDDWCAAPGTGHSQM